MDLREIDSEDLRQMELVQGHVQWQA